MGVYSLNSNYTIDRFNDSFPKNVEGLNNTSYFYYRKVLISKMYSVLRPVNFPSEWDIDYIYDTLFNYGYLCVSDTTCGVLPLQCGISGFNVFNKPTQCIVANPVLGNFTKQIGKNCELLYFWNVFGQYSTINEIITRYAVKLASIDGSLDVSLMNSRVAHVFEVSTQAEKKTLEKMYDDVSKGKPVVVLKKGSDAMFDKNTQQHDFLNVKNTYIGNELIITKNSIMNDFLTEIGIKNANTDKRERLNGDEVNSNNQETLALVDLWLDTLNKCCDKINKMFNLNISFVLNRHLNDVDMKVGVDSE